MVFQSGGGIQDNAVPSKANANQAKAMQEKIFRATKFETTKTVVGIDGEFLLHRTTLVANVSASGICWGHVM